jgi:transcriptional regulator with XRE-family HTH domain
MAESWRDLREPHERLRWARLHRTPFARPTDAARSLNIRPGTYRTYELAKADGGRAPSIVETQRIAKKFGVSWQWILTGDGTPDEPKQDELREFAERLQARFSEVEPAKQEDALRAVEGVLEAFRKRA